MVIELKTTNLCRSSLKIIKDLKPYNTLLAPYVLAIPVALIVIYFLPDYFETLTTLSDLVLSKI